MIARYKERKENMKAYQFHQSSQSLGHTSVHIVKKNQFSRKCFFAAPLIRASSTAQYCDQYLGELLVPSIMIDAC